MQFLCEIISCVRHCDYEQTVDLVFCSNQFYSQTKFSRWDQITENENFTEKCSVSCTLGNEKQLLWNKLVYNYQSELKLIIQIIVSTMSFL